MTQVHLLAYGDDWATLLAETLNRAGSHIAARSIEFPCVNPVRLTREVARADVIVRLGVRPGGPGKRFLLLDTLWQMYKCLWPRKTFIYYWIGTDVMQAVAEFAAGNRPYFLIRSLADVHLANAPWLAEELHTIGLTPQTVLFPVSRAAPPARNTLTWPDRFAVMAYIPDHRHGFYGGDSLVEAARRLPEVEFLVTAGTGDWLSAPPDNVKFLGMRNDMGRIYNSVHAVVRQVQHDAVGGTVREGLFYARHVIYSYPLPHTLHVAWQDTDRLVDTISHLYQQFRSGRLQPNFAGRDFALQAWAPDTLMNRFVKAVAGAYDGKQRS